MKIYIIIYFWGSGVGNVIGWNFFKKIEKEKNIVFMLYIVYNLGMKLVYYKNGLCRFNNFGENKIVEYDVYVDVKISFCLLLFKMVCYI